MVKQRGPDRTSSRLCTIWRFCSRSAQSSQKGKISSHLRHRLTVLGRLFHDRFPHESFSECSRRYEVTIGIPLCSDLPGQVLILAQETLFTTSPRSPQSYTSARSLNRRSTFHHNRTPANRISCHHRQPYQHPASIPKDP